MAVVGGGIKKNRKEDKRAEERSRGKKIKKSQPVRCAE